MSLTGLYGEPLEYVGDLLTASDAFSSLSPTSDVRYYSWPATDTIAAGDGWAALRYPQDGHRMTRGTAGSGSAAYGFTRLIEVTLTQAVAELTDSARSAFLNLVSDIVSDVLAADDDGMIASLTLRDVAEDSTEEFPLIGATLRIELGISV